MFKNLLQFWKGKDFLNQVLDEFTNMLNDTQNMFDSVRRKLINNEEVEGLKDTVYEIDRKVNSLERDIRKRIVEHLSINPSVDTAVCLLLMSVVKDAERLGDFCKNLFEVTELLDKPIDKKKYKELFGNIDEELSVLFKRTRDAFIQSDEQEATQTWDHERSIIKKCDEIIEKLAKSNFSVNEAVCFTLMSRYFKRLSAHLANITTSVILPIDKLDYFDEKRKDEDNV